MNETPATLEEVESNNETRLEEEAKHLVYWTPGDPEKPFNFTLSRKWVIIIIMALQMFWAASLGTMFAPASRRVREEFMTSAIVSRLPLAMFLFGFSLGPIVLTPLAEDYGRKQAFPVTLLISYVFTMGCAASHNITTLCVCRFFAALFASPIFNAVCDIPDLFESTDVKGLWALNFWALTAESIVMGPIFGEYIMHRWGWRWIFWIGAIVGIALIIPLVIFCPETRAGPILAKRAERARKSGKNPYAWAIQERLGRRSYQQVVEETVLRPLVMLFTEPIVLFFGIYDGLNYAIIYLCIESVPLIYSKYGFSELNVNLVFLSMEVGFIVSPLFFLFQLWAIKRAEKRSGKSHVPEHKLLWGMVGCIFFPISLYWFAWTSQPSVLYIVSMIALFVFAIASHVLFLVVSDYTVESYGVMAASAITGQSFFREALCGVLTLVTVPFYENLGYQWASTVLAILATVMAPIPFVFYYKGPQIRAASRYARELARLGKEEKEREEWLEAQVVAAAAAAAEESVNTTASVSEDATSITNLIV